MAFAVWNNIWSRFSHDRADATIRGALTGHACASVLVRDWPTQTAGKAAGLQSAEHAAVRLVQRVDESRSAILCGSRKTKHVRCLFIPIFPYFYISVVGGSLPGPSGGHWCALQNPFPPWVSVAKGNVDALETELSMGSLMSAVRGPATPASTSSSPVYDCHRSLRAKTVDAKSQQGRLLGRPASRRFRFRKVPISRRSCF